MLAGGQQPKNVTGSRKAAPHFLEADLWLATGAYRLFGRNTSTYMVNIH